MSQGRCSVFELDCAIQNYPWGKVGLNSEVARLCENKSSFTLKDDLTYAELWMGAHVKAPSLIRGSNQNLLEWLKDNKSCLGEKVNKHFKNGELPFLFKVLSVNKALSIQAHPNKIHAEYLRRTKPDIYPDDNHKPEIAIALTRFEGLCGFRSVKEITFFLKEVKEFYNVVGGPADRLLHLTPGDDQAAVLKECFTALMTCDAETIRDNLSSLVTRLSAAVEQGEVMADIPAELFLRVHSQFPGDIGCFCIFFLTHQVLAPGQAMFLEANLPHAYLAGDCIECMACSDNVVRAGLTPKFIDVHTLCEMLLYEPRSSQQNMFLACPDKADPFLTVYDPPVPDFTVVKIEVTKGIQEYTLKALDSASILLVITGSGRISNPSLTKEIIFNKGTVLFIGAEEELSLNISSDGVQMYRAYCQL